MEITAIVGASQLRDSMAERAFHTRGRSYQDLLHLRAGDLTEAPDAVVYPRGTDEVLAVLALAADHHSVIIPFGGGTCLNGGLAAIRGECESVIALDLSDMDRIIAIDSVSRTAEVEAGIYGPALESALKAKGLTLGHAPQSFEFSTLGGWIAAGGSAVSSPQEWLAAAKLATPTGLINTAEGGEGPDLTPLVCGSEGQFGIVTEATIRLKPLPQENHLHAYLFADFPTGLAALRTAHQEGCGPVLLHLCDVEETRVFGAFEQLGRKPGLLEQLRERYRAARGLSDKPCCLIAGFEGDTQSALFQRRRFENVARRYRGMILGRSAGEAARPWRFQGPYIRDSLLERAVGVERFEVSVHWSKLQNVYETTAAALDTALRETAPREGAHGLVLCHVPQATANGATLVFTTIFPRAIGTDLEQADKIEAAALRAMQSCGAVPHYGFGPARQTQVSRGNEEGAATVLRAIKSALDPQDVLVPGKLPP